jgi:surfeit locus 1 family protein
VIIKGSLYRTLAGGLQLDDGIEVPVEWPVRVGWITAERAQVLYQKPFYSYQVRLDSGSPGALETGWPVVSINPEKHIAYSVQWFLMSGVLILMGIAANSNLIEWLQEIFRSFRHD